MNKKIIIANWKLNPRSLTEAEELFESTIEAARPYAGIPEIVVCPPFVYLDELSSVIKPKPDNNSRIVQLVFLGAQDVFWEQAGAYTGEISAKQLAEFNVKYVLVGHSERRALGETDEMINKKLLAVLAAGMKPVLLVGEKERGEHQDILIDQLMRDLAGVTAGQLDDLMIVYEPVWAISSHSGGVSDTPEAAAEAMATIKEILRKMWGDAVNAVPILYGGSVSGDNAVGFFKVGFNGAVVGAASLKPEEFKKVLAAGQD